MVSIPCLSTPGKIESTRQLRRQAVLKLWTVPRESEQHSQHDSQGRRGINVE